MKHNRIKLFATVLFVIPVIALAIFNIKPLGTIVKASDAAADYTTLKCGMCHGAKADKAFDTTKTDEVLTEAIIKGKKGEKPPNMPAFETKLTAEQAKALVTYMRDLRKPAN